MIKLTDLVTRVTTDGTATIDTIDNPAVSLRLRQVYGLIAALLAAGHTAGADTIVWAEGVDHDDIVITTGALRFAVTPSGDIDRLCLVPGCASEPEAGIAACRLHLDFTHPGMEPVQGPEALREWYLKTWREHVARNLISAQAAVRDRDDFGAQVTT